MQDKPGLRGLTIWPRRNGKDLSALNIVTAKAIQRPGLYLYIGPLHTQTRQIMWMGSTNEGRKFRDYIPAEIIKGKPRNSVMEIDLINGSMIKVVGSDQYDSLMGLNCVGAVFTEYSLQRPEAWDYIRPMMAENGGWALFNGTPRGMNHMYSMYQMAHKNPDWFVQYLTCEDTGHPSLEAINEEREGGMRESLIEQEFYCSWTSSSEEVFIPLDIIEPTTLPAAATDPGDYNFEPRILGCDVAFAAKGDKATIAYRQGRKLHFLRWYQGMDNMAFANEIARYIEIIKPHAVFVDAGRGEGVISRLVQLGYANVVIPVNFGGKVYEGGILNMKGKMWLNTLSWFMADNKPDLHHLDEAPEANEEVLQELITELSSPFMTRNEKNQVGVESNAALKTRGISSLDLASGLVLTFAEEVQNHALPHTELERMGITADMYHEMSQMLDTGSYNPATHLSDLYDRQFQQSR